MASLDSVVAALARSVVFHGNAQPEDAQLVSEWLAEQSDDATDDGKTFKPTGKK